jgi:apolipoprotein N-acyltransferase
LNRRDLPRSRGAFLFALVTALLVSAYTMVAAIDSPHHWWLGCIPLLPLFIVIGLARPLPALAAGGLWGAGVFAFAQLSDSVVIEPGPVPVVLLLLIPAFYAFIMARVTRQAGFSPLLMGIGWMGLELALQPLGLKHGLLAGTQGDSVAFRLVGSLTGFVLVAFAVAYLNALLLPVLTRILRSASSPRVSPVVGARGVRLILRDALLVPFQLIASARPRAPPFVG